MRIEIEMNKDYKRVTAKLADKSSEKNSQQNSSKHQKHTHVAT